jgi:hypothetical protein
MFSKAKSTCEVDPRPPSHLDWILLGKVEDELIVDESRKGSRHERDADVQFVVWSVVLSAGHSFGQKTCPKTV